MNKNKRYFRYKKNEEISQKVDCQLDNKFDETNEKVTSEFAVLKHDFNQMLSSMRSELQAVKEIAIEKEAKIRRYEDGYDQKNIKSFIKEIIRVVDFAKSERNIDDKVEIILEDLEILLENEGIEKIDVHIKDKYKGLEKEVKVISTIDTDNLAEDKTIHSIKKEGYFLELSEGNNKLIRPTEVVIYKYKKEEINFTDKIKKFTDKVKI